MKNNYSYYNLVMNAKQKICDNKNIKREEKKH